MKIRTRIPKKSLSAWERIEKLRDSYRCKGRIKAEGKKSKPPVCFRSKSEGTGSSKVTVLELHSKVTGKPIGFFGGRSLPFVKTKEEAKKWDYLNGGFAPDEFQWFLRDAGQKQKTPWNRNAKEGLKLMEREARK